MRFVVYNKLHADDIIHALYEVQTLRGETALLYENDNENENLQRCRNENEDEDENLILGKR